MTGADAGAGVGGIAPRRRGGHGTAPRAGEGEGEQYEHRAHPRWDHPVGGTLAPGSHERFRARPPAARATARNRPPRRDPPAPEPTHPTPRPAGPRPADRACGDVEVPERPPRGYPVA